MPGEWPAWVLDHVEGGGRSVSLIDERQRTGRRFKNRYYLWLTYDSSFDPSSIARLWSDEDHATPSLALARRAFRGRKEQLEKSLPLLGGRRHKPKP